MEPGRWREGTSIQLVKLRNKVQIPKMLVRENLIFTSHLNFRSLRTKSRAGTINRLIEIFLIIDYKSAISIMLIM